MKIYLIAQGFCESNGFASAHESKMEGCENVRSKKIELFAFHELSKCAKINRTEIRRHKAKI